MELTEIPAGYTLQFYDDCGVAGRQPHVPTNAAHTFSPGQVNADEKARTVTYGTPNFDMAFEGLQSGVQYVVAVTYASEKGNRRIQSLVAGSVELHGRRVLPDGTAQRFLFQVPASAIEDGKLALHFICNEGHNAVASIVELWAPLPARKVLNLDLTPHIAGKLAGVVSDIAYAGIGGAGVTITNTQTGTTMTTTTGADGRFEADVADQVQPGVACRFQAVARIEDMEAKAEAASADLCFEEPRFRPIAGRVAGIERTEMLLDGVWRICPEPPDDFHSASAEGPGWADFTVPGQWLQQGLDIPRDKTVGVATRFAIPESWREQRLFLRFDAIHGGARYWLNGHCLGESENLFTPVEFDITDAARLGEENRLCAAIKVDTPSELASFSSNYAFHNLGGIDRSVRVFALPPVHLADLRYGTVLDDGSRDATFSLTCTVANTTGQSVKSLVLRAKLTGPDAQRATLAEWDLPLDIVAPGETDVSKACAVTNPLKWTAEKPHLYRLTITLCRGKTIIERLERTVGFREVKVRDGQLWLNGQCIKLAGVNRHEIDPLTGRAATATHGEEDARLLRDANFNYVRTSHYPPTEEFLDACDRYGLYVECEAPFCWARGGHGEDDPKLARQFLTPTAAMIRFHRNHPCIVLWSLANESGNGPDSENRLPANFTTTLEYCRKHDPSRPVLFNNEWARDGRACDVAVVHYPPWPPESYEYVKDDPRPVLIDEYFPPQTFTFAEELKLNPGLDIVNWSTGQSGPNSFWGHIYASNRVIGGAIWAGIDEEFFLPGDKSVGYGAWGFIDVWRRPKSLWWDAKCIHSPIWVPVRRVDCTPDQKTVRIPIENRFAFTDLNEVRIDWEIGPKKGRNRVEAPPGSTGTIEVPVPRGTADGALLVLRFFDLQDRLITAHGVTLGNPEVPAPPNPSAGVPEWGDDGHAIVVNGRRFHMSLEKAATAIHSETIRMAAFPTLFVTRREDRNVFNPGGVPYAQYPDPATRVIDSVTAEPRDGALAIIVRDHYTGFAGSIELLLDQAGVCSVSFDYQYTGEAFNVSELGLRFLMDPICQTIEWRRQSEWDVYPEDHIGRAQGRAEAQAPAAVNGRVNHPTWPWRLDANEFGTRDFHATKYNIYHARLRAPDGSGLRVASNATADVRACLAPGAVQFHVLQSQIAGQPFLPWPLSPKPAQLTPGTRLMGAFSVQLMGSAE